MGRAMKLLIKLLNAPTFANIFSRTFPSCLVKVAEIYDEYLYEAMTALFTIRDGNLEVSN